MKWDAIREQFPIIRALNRGKPLVYLDVAATTHMPQSVIDAINIYHATQHANIHRGIYALSEQATLSFEATRDRVQKFINAKKRSEIVFTHGSTESINVVAHGLGADFIHEGDEIILSVMEHHANIVPWQFVCAQKGAQLRVIPLTKTHQLNLKAYSELLNEKTRCVAIAHASNVLGTINPIAVMTQMAHERNVPVLVDGAQYIPHRLVDVQALDCDFYVFSSHKLYGPTGFGILYGKEAWLDRLRPHQGGGGMVRQVRFSNTDYQDIPYKFEAGTPHIAGAVGLEAAISFLESIQYEQILKQETELKQRVLSAFDTLSDIRVYHGTQTETLGIIAWTMDGIHAHDVASILDAHGVAVRAGHHCAMPLMDYYQVPAMTRLSLGLYNTHSDIDSFLSGLESAMRLF